MTANTPPHFPQKPKAISFGTVGLPHEGHTGPEDIGAAAGAITSGWYDATGGPEATA